MVNSRSDNYDLFGYYHDATISVMDMKTFLKSIKEAEREAIAKAAHTSVAYLWQIAGGHRTPSRALAERLEEVSGGRLCKVELVFPEIATTTSEPE